MRVMLVHLDPAAAERLLESLRDDGHEVTLVVTPPGASTSPPDVVVVCLDAQPQRTLDLAARIATATQTPAPSLLFAGGTPSALQEAQRRFPKASFARLDSLSTALASMHG